MGKAKELILSEVASDYDDALRNIELLKSKAQAMSDTKDNKFLTEQYKNVMKCFVKDVNVFIENRLELLASTLQSLQND